MKKSKLEPQNELKVENIEGFMKKKVTRFGTGAKVDCPKEFIDKTVYLVITNEKEENK
jgi:putative transposon-encoded protein